MATPVSSVPSERLEQRAVVAERTSAEWAILATIALSTILAPLNSTMIAVALPDVMRTFGSSLATTDWLVTGYLIIMAAIQPVSGKLGDRLGRRRMLLGGLCYFGVASLGAALAPTLPVLLLFRFQQALAGAIALPNAAALVREVIPAERRAGSYGMVGAATGLAAASGPPLGGLLVGTAGWQAIFWVNVPFVVAALFLGWRALPASVRRSVPARFDVVGAVLLFAVLAGLSLLLRQAGAGISDAFWLATIALVVGAAILVWQELRHPDPVFRTRFFGNRAFSAAAAAVCLSNLAMYSTLLALPIILSHRANWTSAKVGLVLTALSAASAICGPIGGRLADRFGRRWPVVGGLVILSIGLLPLALTGVASAAELLIALAVAGVGLGLSSAGMQTAAVEAVGPHEAGAASGMFSTSRYIGSIAGTSILPAFLGASAVASGNGVFIMVVAAAILSVAASLGLRSAAAA